MTVARALGYCRAGLRMPPGFAAMECGALAVVVSAAAPADTPRDRLAACLTLHEALHGFLPLSPREPAAPEVAQAMLNTRYAGLEARLAAVEGRFEAVLDLVHDAAAPSAPLPSGGRAWLGARRDALLASAQLQAAAQGLLSRLTEGLGAAEYGRVISGPNVMRQSVLLPDAALDELRRRTAHVGTACGLSGACLTVTAPWPAFSFAMPQDAPCPAST